MNTHDVKTRWFEDDDVVSALDFGLAVSVEDFEGALHLLHDRYVWRGYMAPDTSGRRVMLHNILPTTKLVVAKAGDRVVGTLTVVEDSRLGLPMDDPFGPELGHLRDQGWRLAETSSLALAADYRSSGVAILCRLLRLVVLYTACVARLDRLCFLVQPRHRDFYRALFPFAWFPERRTYRRFNGPAAYGVHLDLELVRALIRVERAGFSPGANSHFLCGPEAVEHTMTRLRRDLPRSALTPLQWARIFADAGGQWASQTDPATVQLGGFIGAVHSEAGGSR